MPNNAAPSAKAGAPAAELQARLDAISARLAPKIAATEPPLRPVFEFVLSERPDECQTLLGIPGETAIEAEISLRLRYGDRLLHVRPLQVK